MHRKPFTYYFLQHSCPSNDLLNSGEYIYLMCIHASRPHRYSNAATIVIYHHVFIYIWVKWGTIVVSCCLYVGMVKLTRQLTFFNPWSCGSRPMHFNYSVIVTNGHMAWWYRSAVAKSAELSCQAVLWLLFHCWFAIRSSASGWNHMQFCGCWNVKPLFFLKFLAPKYAPLFLKLALICNSYQVMQCYSP